MPFVMGLYALCMLPTPLCWILGRQMNDAGMFRFFLGFPFFRNENVEMNLMMKLAICTLITPHLHGVI